MLPEPRHSFSQHILAELLMIDRREMGERGREFALGRFSSGKMVEELEKVYAEALHGWGAHATEVG